MIQPLYFLDETIWRGRMIETVSELKCLIIEIAAWAAGLYLAVWLSKELPWAPALGGAAAQAKLR